MSGRMLRGMTLAVVAGALALPVCSAGDDKTSNGKLQEKQFEKEVIVKLKLSYLLYLPKDYGKDDKAWPLVLFLHGAGDKIERLKRGGLPRLVEKKESPFILIAPQSPAKGWDVRAVALLLD